MTVIARSARATAAVVCLLVLLWVDRAGAGMCVADGAASVAFGGATAQASARIHEATGHAFRAFAALEEGSPSAAQHFGEARRLLDEAIGRYREALARVEDVAQVDAFLKERPFERLQAIFGLAPGSLEQRRWQALAKIARDSRTPTADLLRVCLAGAETLKTVATSVTRETQPAQRRRSQAQWHLILMHGALVSDALDASLR